MIVGKCIQEGAWAFPYEVSGADKISRRLETNDLVLWPGMRTPSRHSLCHVDVPMGMLFVDVRFIAKRINSI